MRAAYTGNTAVIPCGAPSRWHGKVWPLLALWCLLVPGGHAEGRKDADAALANACHQKNLEDVREALKAGADPNARNLEKTKPVLHEVLWDGSVELVNVLLEGGAKADREDDSGWTALHAAARAFIHEKEEQQAVANLRRIIATGVDIHHKSASGEDALAVAAGNHSALVRVLLEAGAKVSPAAVKRAVEESEPECLDLVVKAGGDLKSPLEGGRILMHAACGHKWGWPPSDKMKLVFDRLLAAGLKVDQVDETGMTPLLLAAYRGNRPAVEWLLAHGADVKVVDNAGRTALLAAAESERDEHNCFAPLIVAGCPLSVVSKARVTVLDAVLYRRWWDSANILLHHGAVPNDAAKVLRETLLAWREVPASPAATRGIVIRLLRRLPDTRSLRIEGRPLLHELFFLGEESLVKAALKSGADVNGRDSQGRTALMWAALIESEKMQALLRASGADESLRDADGKSAAELASVFRQPPAELPPPPPASDPADLFAAITMGDAVAVERFLTADKLAVQSERFGLRPVHVTAINGQRELTELLVKHGVDLSAKSAEGATPINLAARAGRAAWCRWFIEQSPAERRKALVAEAARASDEHRHLTLAVECLRLGYKPNMAELGRTIHLAISADNPDVLRELLSLSGGKVPGPGENGDPFAGGSSLDVLESASRMAGPEVLGLVINATAAKEPELWRESVNKAFSAAICLDKVQSAAELFKTGLLVDKPLNEFHQPPLTLAVEYGNTAAVKFLLEHRYKIEPGSGLLRTAAEKGNTEMVSLLLETGAAPDEADKDGNTAMHSALRAGHETVVEKLLAAGASVQVKNKSGLTAADVADEEGYAGLADSMRARPAK